MEIQFSIPLARPKNATSGRKRHVKCDETRPACLNCVKWRGYCDSYADPGEDKDTGDSAELIHTKKAPLILTEPLVNTLRFTSNDQRAYFDEWAALSVTFLSGGLSQTRLWTATMPQLTLEEPTLRYGAMAVGALRRACGPGNSLAALTGDNRHYLNAVVLYCEALRLQSKAQPTSEGLRTALLSSLLFICFESQRGNMPAALKHITHGFSMLNELAGCTPRAPDLVRIAPAPPSMVQEILDCYKPLELQSRSFMGSYKRFFFKGENNRGPPPQQPPEHPGQEPPPEPRVVSPRSSPQWPVGVYSPASEPATPQSQQIGMLSPQSLDSPSTQHTTPGAPTSYTSSPPSTTTPPGHQFPGQAPGAPGPPHRPPGIAPFTKHSPYFRPKRTTITTLQEMPREFKDVEETQGYWALVQRNLVQYLPLLTATTAQLALAKAASEAEVEAKLTAIRQNPSIAKFIADCRYWIQRWTEAYEPLYRGFLRNAAADPAAYLHAINLRIEYLILYVYTTVPRYAGLITARGLTPQYREITVLAETLLRARPNCGFAMDSGWTWPLFIAAFGCRDPAVRADAVRILGQYPIRNALRDSRVYRAIALRNEEVERAIACDDDENTQWIRLRRREVLFEDFGASVVLRSVCKDPLTGVWEPVEEIADFQVRPDGHLNWRRQPISDATSILGGVC
ncbi:C6 zinc finger domain [Cordyceps militaris]|uniref:C6 zinc finger domain n=1 Tax=Cordyceps militaris TaxID=73501 RepID=A0A2H4SWK2_CORMI|nr:C6 zinc finger domain [Cordyceps militaris]